MDDRRRRLARGLWDLADLEAASSARRSFRSRAYREAVWSLDALAPDLSDPPERMLSVPGIGKGLVAIIEEFRATGEVQRLEALRAVLPAESATLRLLPRMNPTKLRWLKAELGVDTVGDLQAVLDMGEVAEMPGVGPATVALWTDRIEREISLPGIPISRAVSFANRLISHVERHVPGTRMELGGAVERLEDRVHQIDLMTEDDSPGDFLEGSALTEEMSDSGSRFITPGGEVVIHPAATVPVEPAGSSPAVAGLRGDLHRHSDWSSDGHDSIESIVEGSVARRLEYVAITDHAADLAFGGLSADDLARQRALIVELSGTHPDLLLLQGAELNIGRDGSLDYDAPVLERLDFRLAAVHSFFDLDEPEQTRRVLTAILNPLVHVIGHLTGRRIGVRPPIRLDLPAIFEAAAETSTALEVNGHLDRLDLPAEHVRQAASMGVLFAANSDAHRHREWDNLANSVTILRRAGVSPEQVVNTWGVDRFLDWLDRSRH